MSIYVSIICFLSIISTSIFATESPFKDNLEIITNASPRTHLPSRNLVLLDSSVFYSPGNDFPQNQIVSGVRRSISPIALPHLPSDMLYVMDALGNFSIYGYSGENIYRICVYGPDNYGLVSFVTEGGGIEESFARTFRRTHYPYKPPIDYKNLQPVDKVHKYNKSHKIGREYTIPQTHNSNVAVNNFYAGCGCLNQGAENAVVSVPGMMAYGKILLFEPTPHSITQKIKGTPRNQGRVQTNIFFGIIFKSLFQQGSVKIHYFPHDKGHGETQQCYYQTLYNHFGAYASVIRNFEIQNAAYLFEPLIWDLRKSPQELRLACSRTFYLGLNLMSNFSIVEGLSLSRQFNLPIAWNGVRGMKNEEVQRMVSAIHSRNLNKTQVVVESTAPRSPYYTVWNNFCLPSNQGGKLTWVDAEHTEIPLVPITITTQHRDFFLSYLGLRLMEDAAKHQTDSIAMKLIVSKIYYGQGKYIKAKEWINLAYKQCFEYNSLAESLMLVRTYFEQWFGLKGTILSQRIFDNDIAIFTHLIFQKQRGAFLEELMDLEKFNQEMAGKLLPIPTKMTTIKRISSDNSKLLKGRLLRPSDIKCLIGIIETTQNLEEISLENALFYVDDDECVKFVHLYDDEYDDEPISAEEFFWNEERPLSKILTVLQKHSLSLKKLSLSNITFNGRSNGKRVIQELKKANFINLEELSLVGNTLNNADVEEIEYLRNLTSYFPKIGVVLYDII